MLFYYAITIAAIMIAISNNPAIIHIVILKALLHSLPSPCWLHISSQILLQMLVQHSAQQSEQQSEQASDPQDRFFPNRFNPRNIRFLFLLA